VARVREWKRKSNRKRYRGPEPIERGPARTAFGLARQHTMPPIADDRAAIERVRAERDRYRLELAWDGHRVLACRLGDDVRLSAIDFRDWSDTFAAIAQSLRRLPCESVVLEGTLCAVGDDGRPSFDLLRTRAAEKSLAGVTLVVWDVHHLDGEDLRGMPLAERCARLQVLLAAPPPRIAASEALLGDVDQVLGALRGHGVRGLVARAADRPLPPPDDDPWIGIAATDEPLAWHRHLSPPPPVTNATKVLYPRDGLTKTDLVAYYADVAGVMLPYMRDRAAVMQRWPDGIDDFMWYQHRMPPRAPDYLKAVWIEGIRRIVIGDVDGLLWLVNQAALTYHGFASRIDALAEPDWSMIDLDPGDATTWWDDTIAAAMAVRRTLELLELPSVVKTSGQRGLHVLVPLARGHDFAQAEALAAGIANLVARLMPDKVCLDMDKEKRAGRLLLDHKQFAGKTLVLPYSLRAVDGAPASCPIRWDEVTTALVPRDLGVRSLRARLDRHGDLFAAILDGGVSIAPALATLARGA
jgi:bifunctional non-homologous end joining protein LigD